MEHAQTIAMATDLLAEGRAEDVVQMVDPLLTDEPPSPRQTGQVRLRTLRARIEIAHRDRPDAGCSYLPSLATIGDLCTCVRAEVALWRGWARALPQSAAHDPSRALYLLTEAGSLFDSIHDQRGQCWTLLGRARAYAALGEFVQMEAALDAVAPLVSSLESAAASRWYHQLRIPPLRAACRFAEARSHVDALSSLGERLEDVRIQGVALSNQARLRFDQGASPSALVDLSEQAISLLHRLPTPPPSALSAAYLVQGRAHLRQGRPKRAREVLAQARDRLSDPDAFEGLAARIHLNDDAPERAHAAVSNTSGDPHEHRATLALLRGRIFAADGQPDTAQRWYERARLRAAETGHRSAQCRALLHRASLALAQDDLPSARSHREEAESLGVARRALPSAADVARVRGRLHRHADQPQEAGTAFRQSHRAASMAGDTRRQQALAPYRSLLSDETASSGASFPEFPEGLAAVLAEGPSSLLLVAATCLDAFSSDHPDSWMAVCRSLSSEPATVMWERGTPPDDRPLASEDVQFIPLLPETDHPFTLATASEAVGQAIRSQLASWRPFLRLALHQHSITEGSTRPSCPIPLDGFIAQSTPMQRVQSRVQILASSHHPVLITGEGGAGKRLVARALHALSPRSEGPFQNVACASMQHDPTEDRLFGAEADDGTVVPGAVHRADGGILLLEDVDALSLSAQERLLHLLDTGEVPLPGSPRTHPVDIRVVATTQADLDAALQTDHVRPALRDRLCGHSIAVPPLRDRRADLPLLVRHFLDTLRPSGSAVASITQPAMEALLRYRWPGNVRQLRNEIERALVYVSNDPAPVVDLDVLADPIVESAQDGASSAPPADDPDAILHPNESLDNVLARTEKTVIERVLRACDGQVTASADMLDLTRQGLYKKMKRLDIDASTFQSPSEPAPTSA
jgi:DNA-binding NtrC family response regulator/tetratricopeptide (TPR) repeat protein